MSSRKFHIYKGINRTTVTIPSYISDLLEIEKGLTPGTTEAYRFTQKTLQKFADIDPRRAEDNLSQWLQEEAILSLLDKKQVAAFRDWKQARVN